MSRLIAMSGWFAAQPTQHIENSVILSVEYERDHGTILSALVDDEPISPNAAWKLIGRKQPQLDAVREWLDGAYDEQIGAPLRGAA